MSENIGEDILRSELEYTHISLLSHKLRVLIIGGGRAGFIKCRTFAGKGALVTVVARGFIEDFDCFRDFKNVTLLESSYAKELLRGQHMVAIAVSDISLEREIIEHCKEADKLYLNCRNFREGMFSIPVQMDTDSSSFSLNTRGGSPKTSKFLGKIIQCKLKEYDELVNFSCTIREKLKGTPFKDEILDFISTEDFKFFMEKGHHEEILKIFYGGINFEYKNCD